MKILFLEESNHLSYSKNPLTIGGWIVPKDKIKSINNEIKKIKIKHGIKSLTELKWKKIGISKLEAYKEVVKYAIENKDMQLRVLVAKRPKKIVVGYKNWYTRLHYALINRSPFSIQGVISDKKGFGNEQELNNTLEVVIGKVAKEYVNSNHSQIIQLSDIFLGAIASQKNIENISKNKAEIINIISKNINIRTTTSFLESQNKYNIFYWGLRE